MSDGNLADQMRAAWRDTPISNERLRELIAAREEGELKDAGAEYNATAAVVLREILARREGRL